jgi:hypothetical protein
LIISDSTKYACSTHLGGGPAACKNSRRYRRTVAEERLLAEIRDGMLTPENLVAFKQARGSGTAPAPKPVNPARRIAALTREIERYLEAIGSGLLSPALRAKLEAAEAEKMRLLATPQAVPPERIARVFKDATKHYREMVAGLPAVLARDPGRAQAVLGQLFGTIPVTPAGKARITLDFERVLSLVGANDATAWLVGSGGRI